MPCLPHNLQIHIITQSNQECAFPKFRQTSGAHVKILRAVSVNKVVVVSGLLVTVASYSQVMAAITFTTLPIGPAFQPLQLSTC